MLADVEYSSIYVFKNDLQEVLEWLFSSVIVKIDSYGELKFCVRCHEIDRWGTLSKWLLLWYNLCNISVGLFCKQVVFCANFWPLFFQNAYTSVKVGAVTVYTAGHGEEWGSSVDTWVGLFCYLCKTFFPCLFYLDTYEFLRDPSPGFMPRVGVITVSGLAGLILARKGNELLH